MKGYLNHRYPNAKNDYEAAMTVLRKDCGKPVFSFEVGQFEVLPDFGEIADFRGVTRAVNYELIRKKVEQSGAMDTWTKQVEATGELSNLCYREEVEAALRTERYSGISLLGIQDFPGQGTALVGMLNAHLQPKPYPFAQPERFRAFFRDVLPLALLEKYTYENTETLVAQVKLANYGKADLTGQAQWRLKGAGRQPAGGIAPGYRAVRHPDNAGRATYSIGGRSQTGTPDVDGGNEWCKERLSPVGVSACTTRLSGKRARMAVPWMMRHWQCWQAAERFTWPRTAPRRQLPNSIQAQFSTDFWSVGTFAGQEGGHGPADGCGAPAVCRFSHGDAQQLAVVAHGQSARDDSPAADAGHRNGNGQLCLSAAHGQAAECRCQGGRLMISSMGLHNLQQYPEARALQQAIYAYLRTPGQVPEQELTVDEVRALVR